MVKPRSTTPISIARHLLPRDVAERLNVPEHVLKRLRIEGGGPPYVKFGRLVRYPEPALEAWIAGRLRSSTREPAGAA